MDTVTLKHILLGELGGYSQTTPSLSRSSMRG